MDEKETSAWLPVLMAGAAGLGGFASWVATWTGIKRDVASLKDTSKEHQKILDAMQRHVTETRTDVKWLREREERRR